MNSIVKILVVMVLSLFFVLCNRFDKDKTQKEESLTDSIIDTVKPKLQTKELIFRPDYYRTVSLDYSGKWLQRIFVESSPEIIERSEKLINIICDLDSLYDFEKGTSVSFFYDKKYAKYIDELIVEYEELDKDSFINNWENEMYIGEFVCDSNMLILYPYSTTHKHKVVRINPCTR